MGECRERAHAAAKQTGKERVMRILLNLCPFNGIAVTRRKKVMVVRGSLANNEN